MPFDHETLDGSAVCLDPLTSDHAPALWSVAEPELFRYSSFSIDPWVYDQFAVYISKLASAAEYRPFAIVERQTAQPVGVTCYMDLRPAHRGVEIGATWIARAAQGTHVNPEMKYLMLRHAFETWGMVRVQLKCDGRNHQSQRAIAKLGAQREGVLRKHIVLPDGYIRDTVMFSIVANEWPKVKAGLEDRLGYVP